MSEYEPILTEQELDLLLERPPQFDSEAVKRRTLNRLEESPVRRYRPPALRGFLIAAIVCILSISAVAAADHATGGRIARVLLPQPIQTEAAPPKEAESPAPQAPPTPQQAAPSPSEPEPASSPLPELDPQLAEALQVEPQQAETLRPAVQTVEQSAEDQGVRMTVPQTLGDPSHLYVKLQFDFPEEVPVSEELQFEDIDVTFSQTQGFSLSHPILERTPTSLTCLLKVQAIGETLNGQTITVSFRNYGRPKELDDALIQLELKANEVRAITIDPTGNIINTTPSEEEAAALSADPRAIRTTKDGFTIIRAADGSQLITYDGTHGPRHLTVLRGETPTILTGDDPTFETVLSGTWSQSWQLDYRDTSLRWQGEQPLFDSSLTMTSFRVSPLSWSAVFNGNELAPLILPKQWELHLLHSDGTQTELQLKRTYSSPATVDYRCTLSVLGTFDPPVDLSDVTAVVMDGVTFPLA